MGSMLLIAFLLLPTVVYAGGSSEIDSLCADERTVALKNCLHDDSKDLVVCEKEADEAVRYNPGCGDEAIEAQAPITEEAPTSGDAAIALQTMKAEFDKNF